MKGRMSITVIVCTYNRCQVLAKALESMAESEIPNSVDWEVLVVDNNSVDKTRELVEEYSERYPGRFRYLFEPAQGKSFALNAAIREARGNVLAFTDDDVVVESTWLWSLASPLDNGEWSGTAGRIIPVLNQPLPRWLTPDQLYLAGPFVAFDLGLLPVPLTKAPFGANMAFRLEMFEKYGGFRTDLGRVGDSLRCGEDTEFARRLLAAGEPLCYEPSAVVRHRVPESRLRKGYLLSWFFHYSRSDIAQSGILPETNWSIAGIPLYLFRRLGRWSVEWVLSVKPSRRFACRRNVWSVAGIAVGCFELSRKLKKRNVVMRAARPPSADEADHGPRDITVDGRS